MKYFNCVDFVTFSISFKIINFLLFIIVIIINLFLNLFISEELIDYYAFAFNFHYYY